jgi:transposase
MKVGIFMYAIGIDVSKLKSTVAIIKDGEIFVKPFSIDHTNDGIQVLLNKLNDIDKSNIKIVMESTGIYHLPLLIKLLELNFFVCVENAFLLKKYFDVYLRKVKTDKLDSIKIATYCFEKWHSLKQFTLQDSTYKDLQFLSRQYDQFMVLKVKSKVQLNNLIDMIFPNFNSCFNEDTNQFLFMLDVLEQFYHPSLINKLTESSFVFKIQKLAQKRGLRTGARIATQLYSMSQITLSACPLNSSTKLIIQSCIDTLRGLEKSTNEILSQMDKIASNLPEFKTVSSMSGVGKKTRSRLIAEIGDIRRFNNANSLIAYAGIDTPSYQSGNFSATERHITKRGNKHLRKCGYEIIKSIKACNPSKDTTVYDFIHKKEMEGKPLKVCKIAGLNKFLRIYFYKVSALH